MYFRFIAILREIWILPINSTIWRFNDIKLRHGVNQVMPRCWKWWVNYSVWFWCLYHERFWSHKEGLRSPLPPSPPHPGCIKQKKKNSACLNRAKMRRPQTTTTDKNATAHNQYHVTVCHERFVPRTGCSTKYDEGLFLQVYFRINPNLCPAVEASSWGKEITPTLRSYSVHYPVSEQWKGRQAIPLARPSLTRLNNTVRPLCMHEVAFAFISISKVPLNYSAINYLRPRKFSFVLKVVSEYL